MIGGVHVTALPVLTLTQFPQFDIAVVGEGEQILDELCRAVEQNDPLDPIRGLYYRDGGDSRIHRGAQGTGHGPG